MLKNTLASALPSSAVPSNAMLAAAVKAGAARPLAVSGPGAAACASSWIGGGYPAGTAGGAGNVTGGYVHGFVDAVQPPKARLSATNGGNVQSTVQRPVPGKMQQAASQEALIRRLEKTAIGEQRGESSGALVRAERHRTARAHFR
jgi:hypothetical protein